MEQLGGRRPLGAADVGHRRRVARRRAGRRRRAAPGDRPWAPAWPPLRAARRPRAAPSRRRRRPRACGSCPRTSCPTRRSRPGPGSGARLRCAARTCRTTGRAPVRWRGASSISQVLLPGAWWATTHRSTSCPSAKTVASTVDRLVDDPLDRVPAAVDDRSDIGDDEARRRGGRTRGHASFYRVTQHREPAAAPTRRHGRARPPDRYLTPQEALLLWYELLATFIDEASTTWKSLPLTRLRVWSWSLSQRSSGTPLMYQADPLSAMMPP